MKLSSLSFLFVLLFSSIVLAQHNAGAAPSPPPSPPPMVISSPTPSPSPSPAPSFSPSPSPSPSHSEAPSPAPSPAPTNSIPESHAAPSPSANHDADRVPENRGTENTGVSRPVHETPEKPQEPKTTEPDLRRPCDGGPCKPVAKPAPSSDLRKPCLPGQCSCLPGQTVDKGGCLPTTPTSKETSCEPGTFWNGAACTPTTSCSAGQVWNGSACVLNSCPPGKILVGTMCQADCSSVNARANLSVPLVRSARRERDDACRKDPGGMLCQQLEGDYNNVLAEYRMILAAAPTDCRVLLPDPDSL